MFGAAAEKELLKGGKNIAVSDNNKVCVYACVYVYMHVDIEWLAMFSFKNVIIVTSLFSQGLLF